MGMGQEHDGRHGMAWHGMALDSDPIRFHMAHLESRVACRDRNSHPMHPCMHGHGINGDILYYIWHTWRVVPCRAVSCRVVLECARSVASHHGMDPSKKDHMMPCDACLDHL
jgi:hypothetical protein